MVVEEVCGGNWMKGLLSKTELWHGLGETKEPRQTFCGQSIKQAEQAFGKKKMEGRVNTQKTYRQMKFEMGKFE